MSASGVKNMSKGRQSSRGLSPPC